MRLPSRRNCVVRTRRGIEKTFAQEQSLRTECGQLHLLHARGVAVPQVLARQGRTLLLSDLCAPTLYDALWAMERQGALIAGAEPVFMALAQWLCAYYRAVQHARTGQIRGDMHARNCLWDGARMHGVDFEEVAVGEREADVGALCAYLYTYEPAQTDYKRALVTCVLQCLTQAMGVDVRRVRQYMRREWEAMALRRKGFCMPQDAFGAPL